MILNDKQDIFKNSQFTIKVPLTSLIHCLLNEGFSKVKEISKGGQGSTFKAYNKINFDEPICIKVFPEKQSAMREYDSLERIRYLANEGT